MTNSILRYTGNLGGINQKYFIYNDERFPVDFDELVKQSKYFRDHQSDYEGKDEILLMDDDKDLISLNSDVINKFIKGCQDQPFELLPTELPPFYYLISKFQVIGLIKFIKSQLEGENSELSIQLIFFKLKCKDFYENQGKCPDLLNKDLRDFYNCITNEEEEMVSNKFNELSNDDSFIQLPIQILYRIFEKYLSHHLTNKTGEKQFDPKEVNYDEIDCQQIKIFLMKSLDYHGRPASILFSLIDFEHSQIDIIKELLTRYEHIFNFNYINDTLVRTVFELTSKQSEVITRNEEMTQRYEQQITELIEENKKSKQEMEDILASSRNEISELRQTITKIQTNHANEIRELQQSNQRMIDELRAEMQNELKTIQNTHQSDIDRINIDLPNTFTIPKLTGNESRGICKFLLYNNVDFTNTKGTIKVTGVPDSNDDQATLDKLVTEDNDQVWCSKNDPDASIQFDFGQSSIAFTAFKIWTGDDPENGRHIKDFKISGSNDRNTWGKIASWPCSLNGPNKIFNAVLNRDYMKFYRYLKLQLDGPNHKGTNEIYLKRIEFFGNVKRLF